MTQPVHIQIIGSANMDLVVRAPRMPKSGESLVGHSFGTVPGGKGSNQAIAAARLGAHTRFAGCVGGDAFGAQLRDHLEIAGVDTQHLRAHPTETTGTAFILVEDNGANSIVVTPGANGTVTPDDVRAQSEAIAAADVLLLQLEIPLDSVQAALEIARAAGTLSVLDAGPAQAVPSELLALADVVSPNETEAEALTGIVVDSLDDARRAAMHLREAGAAHVVMKLGGRGCLYLGEEEIHWPAFPVTPVDTTAAGDAFTAALATVWHALPRAEALRFANAAGALATLTPGAAPSMPTRAQVEAFLAEHP